MLSEAEASLPRKLRRCMECKPGNLGEGAGNQVRLMGKSVSLERMLLR